VPVEEGDGQAVELLVGALGHHPVDDLQRGVLTEPPRDGMVSPIVSRSRASVVENTFTPVNGAPTMTTLQ